MGPADGHGAAEPGDPAAGARGLTLNQGTILLVVVAAMAATKKWKLRRGGVVVGCVRGVVGSLVW